MSDIKLSITAPALHQAGNMTPYQSPNRLKLAETLVEGPLFIDSLDNEWGSLPTDD